MPFTLRPVLSGREASLSSFRRVTWTARFVGMQVNNDTTSKDTRISSLGMVCDLINSTKAQEFLTWEPVKPTTGANRPARNLESSYVGEDTSETMGRSGTPGLCTLGSPYSSGTLPAELLSFM